MRSRSTSTRGTTSTSAAPRRAARSRTRLRAKAWNDDERVYRVVGAKTWSLATFIDNLRAAREERRAAVRGHDRRDAQGGAAVRAQLPARRQRWRRSTVKSIWTFSFDAQTTSAGVTSSAQEQRLLRHHRVHVGQLGGDDHQPRRQELPPRADEQGEDRSSWRSTSARRSSSNTGTARSSARRSS